MLTEHVYIILKYSFEFIKNFVCNDDESLDGLQLQIMSSRYTETNLKISRHKATHYINSILIHAVKLKRVRREIVPRLPAGSAPAGGLMIHY